MNECSQHKATRVQTHCTEHFSAKKKLRLGSATERSNTVISNLEVPARNIKIDFRIPGTLGAVRRWASFPSHIPLSINLVHSIRESSQRILVAKLIYPKGATAVRSRHFFRRIFGFAKIPEVSSRMIWPAFEEIAHSRLDFAL